MDLEAQLLTNRVIKMHSIGPQERSVVMVYTIFLFNSTPKQLACAQ